MKSCCTIHPIPLLVGAIFPAPIWRYGAKAAPLCWFLWYIEGLDMKVLVDSGAVKDQLSSAGLTCLRQVQSLEQGLGKVGLEPEDVDLVIQTHLHFDHTGYADKFRNAKFLVQRAELAYHSDPPPLAVDPRPCKKELLDALNWEIVDGDSKIEEGVRVLFTPGHTPGTQSVAVETARGTAVIDGLCSIDEAFPSPETPKDDMAVLVPGITNDPLQGYESQLRIAGLADIIIPLHEIRFAFTDKVPSQ